VTPLGIKMFTFPDIYQALTLRGGSEPRNEMEGKGFDVFVNVHVVSLS
jgi:hypothetical protein